MFRKGFNIEGQEVELTFTDFISEEATIYMVTGLEEPLFMGYTEEESEWHFLTTVRDSLLDLEEDFSECIVEQDEEDVADETFYKKVG